MDYLLELLIPVYAAMIPTNKYGTQLVRNVNLFIYLSVVMESNREESNVIIGKQPDALLVQLILVIPVHKTANYFQFALVSVEMVSSYQVRSAITRTKLDALPAKKMQDIPAHKTLINSQHVYGQLLKYPS